MLANFKIILVETSHPGNIGAVARAMKNMQMDQLRLVNPRFFPHADATARASGGADILKTAAIFDALPAAIADCHLVLGSSARDRTISWPVVTARQCAENWVSLFRDRAVMQVPNIALVFGRENSGLKNHELDLCHYLLRIPCSPEYTSLNLAAAVQVVCYELYVAATQEPVGMVGNESRGRPPLATARQMEAFYVHLQQTIADIGFLHPERASSMMRRLRRIFNRIRLDSKELDILRGILRFAQNRSTR